jgi:hypothetical protein
MVVFTGSSEFSLTECCRMKSDAWWSCGDGVSLRNVPSFRPCRSEVFAVVGTGLAELCRGLWASRSFVSSVSLSFSTRGGLGKIPLVNVSFF